MRICDGPTRLALAITVATPPESARGGDTPGAPARAGGDAAAATIGKVSSRARARARAARVDSHSLASLRARVRAGTYEVDATAIAARLVGSEDDT
jgi:anti-sigma28 factor (negative regulator of flagellin synthesis)